MKIAVFKTGLHTDMNGTSRLWTENDLDRIISQYDPSAHEAPVVIGHPRTDSPAWGWVDSLHREGEVLVAGLKKLAPEFTGWLSDGRYKKRSICLYPDMSLKHIGFLGAMPPAVKGLPDAGFSESADDIIIEFSTKENTMTFEEFKDGLKFWEAFKKEAVVESVAEVKPAPVSFSEADLEAARQKAAQEAVAAERERLTIEFAEKERLAAQKARSEAIKSEVAQMVASGKLPPAWVKSGIVAFMCQLDAGTEIQFAEDAGKQNPLDWFRKFLAELPEVVHFGEVASRNKDVSGDPAGKLEALILQKMTADNSLKYAEALAQAQTENYELAAEYLRSVQQ